MKNILRKATIFALMLGTLSVNAKVTDKVSDDTTVVKFGFVSKGSQIFIKDAEDYLLFKYMVNESGQFIKSFDFTTLPNGNYRFEVHENRTIQIKPFVVTKGMVAFEKTNDYTFFKPTFTPKNNKVTLSWFNMKNEPFEVKIFDTENRLLYKERITKSENVNRIFNLSQVLDKDVLFTVKAGDRTYSERVAITH